ncbi:MAG: carbon-nitrogen hydrolase family protein [Anaerolineae bacterium]|nr:carbon-nitrogen hydrolase family protein [Anaerolineae bacterium]
MPLHIAGAQLPVTQEVSRNVASLLRAIQYAADVGADILLTPEGALSGYTPDFDRDLVRVALEAVTQRGRDAGVGLALGTCFEEDDGRCYNQIRFYDQAGRYLGFHSKQLRCGTLEAQPQGEINDYAVAPLQVFSLGGVKVGGLICNDLWANPECTPVPDPHLTQQLSTMGARVIFHAVNGGRNGGPWSKVAWHYHEANLRMRARAGKLWIVTVDSAHPVSLPCSAPSGVVAPSGDWACQAESQGERFFDFEIPLP